MWFWILVCCVLALVGFTGYQLMNAQNGGWRAVRTHPCSVALGFTTCLALDSCAVCLLARVDYAWVYVFQVRFCADV